MDPTLANLNDAQREAVTQGSGPLIVLAGAGSGKTRVITRRVAHLLAQGAAPESILAVTFTNKAAQEMQRRVQEIGGGRATIATFHSACARFLRADGHHLGYPRDYSIFDTYDRDSCIKMLLQERGLGVEGIKPSHVGNQISRLKNHGTSPEEYREAFPCDVALNLEELTALVYGPYQERLQRLGAMDFDDLLLRFVDLMRDVPEVADRYRERFEWILVDEFQDTNRVQYELTSQLAAGHRNLCVVGDPDQSIYRFRGAEIRNILDFQRDFPDARVIRLEKNYRSTRCILRAAQGVIVHNTQRLERGLDSDREEGPPLRYSRYTHPFQENDRVCEQIVELLSQRVSPAEIAVFYRSHFLSRGLEEVLRRAGVPYEIVGGLSFFDRREIKDLLAYLRVVLNPLDDVSAERIINVPPRRVGKATLDKLRAIAAREAMSLTEVAAQTELHGELAPMTRKGLAALARVLDEVRRQAELGAGDAVRALVEGTDYIEATCDLGDPQDVSRRENIEEMINDAMDFDRRHGGGLSAYLAHVSLLTSEDRRVQSGPTVSLMTVHAAKGLEFDHVFIVGLEEGVLPSSRAESQVDLEEERRLMYVALTRARETLQLSGCDRRMVQGIEIDQRPSRFVDEIPADCLQRATARSRRGDAWTNWEPAGDDEFGPDAGQHDEFSLDLELEPEMRVKHRVFGEGVVQRVSGEGIRARAVVQFADGSERTLLLEYGDLEVLPGGSPW